MDRRILLIEDSEPDRVLLRAALSRLDDPPRLEEAPTGEAGLESLEVSLDGRDLPSLVLLDINLPGVDGHEVLARIRKHERIAGVPVVMLSTSSDPDEVRRCYEAGANAYLVKPESVKRQTAMLADLQSFFFVQAALPYDA